jgi:hypothetical protein
MSAPAVNADPRVRLLWVTPDWYHHHVDPVSSPLRTLLAQRTSLPKSRREHSAPVPS